MLDRDEIVRSLTGAWQLFLNRPDAMRSFDLSVAGFWRSFGAIVLIAPAYALGAMAERQVILADPEVASAFSDPPFIVAQAIVLCLDWVTLPIILAFLAGPLGFARTYGAYIVARNWCTVLSIQPFGVIALLLVADLLDAEAAGFLSLAVLIVVLRYNFIIARRALDVGTGFAIGIVVLDFAVSLTLGATLDGLLGI